MMQLVEGGAAAPLSIFGAIPYLPGIRQGVAAAMASRPQGAQGVADFIRPDNSMLQRSVLSMPFR
jgi:hypothetical protein